MDKKKREQQRQKKSRDAKKEKLAILCAANPEIKEALKIRDKSGRPKLEIEQPELMKAIINIAMHGSAAHEKEEVIFTEV